MGWSPWLAAGLMVLMVGAWVVATEASGEDPAVIVERLVQRSMMAQDEEGYLEVRTLLLGEGKKEDPAWEDQHEGGRRPMDNGGPGVGGPP